ncbi:SIMPL domain-containing protein [Ornithinimicrobium pekingense]|uniref:DUF541 domain-containing protein n=1 Tax=Ornithinimicrobium pekingense TaxID=384677 RepID=A0ABQ2F6T5_9MICO|nr:SIMPL domain-containing protein [Ornithinimicrobium pekingense]GGK66413.1 hypothetical protein GCM10011509_13370 [Ornithinimicrobium pekingense]
MTSQTLPQPPAVPGTVVVIGTGRAGAVPDTLVLDLQLEGHGASVAEAIEALTGASQASHDALPGVDLRTSGLGVHPRHDHQGTQVGHTAYQSLQLRAPDPSAAGNLVRRLGEVVGDALGVTGLRAELADTAELDRRAREAAFDDARGRAEQYAALAGRAVVGVLHVRELVDGPVQPFPRAEARMAAAGGPVVGPADHEVTATVEVTWQLGD